eukprot:GHVH01002387.1.p1 GENE.GHVH01002387.1~~GHVH01002387.1.p1  ORF type:complete len:344 (-),score=62.90 GHVH01002387.1:56-1087(-)
MVDEKVSSLENDEPKEHQHVRQRAPDNHRFYASEFPELEELVLARITNIESMGAYAELLEYGNKEGMLLLSELSKRRFRSVNKLIKVGRVEYVMVIRVDQDKGYIDLSKKRVTSSDIPAAEERYSKSKKVHLSVRHASEKNPEYSVEDIYREVIWPMYATNKHALDGLVLCLDDPEKVFKHVDRSKISQGVLDAITEDIKLRMTPPHAKIRACFDVSCTGYEGVNAVMSAIHAGVKAANEILATDTDTNNDLSVRLIAPPRFIVTCSDSDKERGIERINTVLRRTKAIIEAEDGGTFRVYEETSIYGDDEDVKIDESDSEESDSYDDESDSEMEGMGTAQGEQ